MTFRSYCSNIEKFVCCIFRKKKIMVAFSCYWCILLDYPIAASAHGSASQQLTQHRTFYGRSFCVHFMSACP